MGSCISFTVPKSVYQKNKERHPQAFSISNPIRHVTKVQLNTQNILSTRRQNSFDQKERTRYAALPYDEKVFGTDG